MRDPLAPVAGGQATAIARRAYSKSRFDCSSPGSARHRLRNSCATLERSNGRPWDIWRGLSSTPPEAVNSSDPQIAGWLQQLHNMRATTSTEAADLRSSAAHTTLDNQAFGPAANGIQGRTAASRRVHMTVEHGRYAEPIQDVPGATPPWAPVVVYRQASRDEHGDWLVVSLLDRDSYRAAADAELELSAIPPATRDALGAVIGSTVASVINIDNSPDRED